MGEMRLGRFAGLEVSAVPSAIAGTAALWAVFGVLGALVFHAGLVEAVAGGFALALLHWLSELLHNLGHATAARAVGRPMLGVRLFLVIGISLYPPDEANVTPAMHLRRALGGPLGSSLVTLAAALVTAALVLGHLPGAWVLVLFTLDNLLVFSLGALLPLGFNDGSSVLSALRARRNQA